MNRLVIIISVLFVVFIGILAYFQVGLEPEPIVTISPTLSGSPISSPTNTNNLSSLDRFAQCISSKQVIMYGAYWCSHCQAQKKLFDSSWQYVNYVECTEDVKRCQDAGINGYPTWVFSDGSTIPGETTFSKLAEKTGCKAP